ncbi:endolytic transglycosylase MltG [Geodermatophilus sp. TF02-6]|nr:endolytic transglycosylase MltG [Geodermatophilus sp. TF02-6]
MSDPTPPYRQGRHASPDVPGGTPAPARPAGPRAAAPPAGVRPREEAPRPGAAQRPSGPRPTTPDDDRSTGPLVRPAGSTVAGAALRSGDPADPERPAHPSAPLPDLPPRPAGTWSRLQRRADGAPDDDATVARPVGAVPGVPGGPHDDDTGAQPLDPHARDDRARDDRARDDRAWDDEDSTGGLEVLGTAGTEEPRRPRRRSRRDQGDLDGGSGDRSSGGARRPRRRRSPLAVVLSLAVLAGLVAGIVLGGKALIGLVNPPDEDYTGQGSGSVEVRIAEGDTLSDIARTLQTQGVIASVGPFVDAAETQPAATGIQPGVYAMRAQMSGQAALDLLLDPATRQVTRVTIPEGFTVRAVLERLAEDTGRPLADFEAAAADPAALGLPAYAGGQLEGFLFPATYEFTPDDTPADVLREMVGQFTATAARLQLEQRAAAAGRSPYDVVTVASMVQSETRLDDERRDVAQVVYNRLDRGIALGIDATIAYGLGKNGNDLTVTDLQTDDPYNTRTRPGLPPTPISNPGEASLEAALAPTTGDLLYYVLESADGRHFFTADYGQFQAARERCAAAGLGCGG